jgi:hypothetical protein
MWRQWLLLAHLHPFHMTMKIMFITNAHAISSKFWSMYIDPTKFKALQNVG